MPKVAPKIPRPKAAKVSRSRDPKAVAKRRQIGATFDVAAFDAVADRTAAATAADWAKPS